MKKKKGNIVFAFLFPALGTIFLFFFTLLFAHFYVCNGDQFQRLANFIFGFLPVFLGVWFLVFLPLMFMLGYNWDKEKSGKKLRKKR